MCSSSTSSQHGVRCNTIAGFIGSCWLGGAGSTPDEHEDRTYSKLHHVCLSLSTGVSFALLLFWVSLSPRLSMHSPALLSLYPSGCFSFCVSSYRSLFLVSCRGLIRQTAGWFNCFCSCSLLMGLRATERQTERETDRERKRDRQ